MARNLCTVLLLALVVAVVALGCETEEVPNGQTPAKAEAPSNTGGKNGEVTKTTVAPTKAPTSGNYTVSVTKQTLEVGKPGSLPISIKPKPGFKVNKEFPWKASVTKADGITGPDADLGPDKWKLSDQEATLDVPVTVSEAGDRSVEGTISFSVCNDDRCDVIRDHKVTWTVAAK